MKDVFKAASVQCEGPVDWIEKFNTLSDRLPRESVVQMQDKEELPDWLDHLKGYSVWERNNKWMLHHAFADGDRVSLIALWDGAGQDGEGGTMDMVTEAKRRGAAWIIINTKELFGL